jgi:hypothetical protein
VDAFSAAQRRARLPRDGARRFERMASFLAAMSVVPDMFELCTAGSYQHRLRRSMKRIDTDAGLSA